MKRLMVLGTKFEDEKQRGTVLARDKSSIGLAGVVSKLASQVRYAVGHVVVERGKVTDAEGREYAAVERFEAYHEYREEGPAREAYQHMLAREAEPVA